MSSKRKSKKKQVQRIPSPELIKKIAMKSAENKLKRQKKIERKQDKKTQRKWKKRLRKEKEKRKKLKHKLKCKRHGADINHLPGVPEPQPPIIVRP